FHAPPKWKKLRQPVRFRPTMSYTCGERAQKPEVSSDRALGELDRGPTRCYPTGSARTLLVPDPRFQSIREFGGGSTWGFWGYGVATARSRPHDTTRKPPGLAVEFPDALSRSLGTRKGERGGELQCPKPNGVCGRSTKFIVDTARGVWHPFL